MKWNDKNWLMKVKIKTIFNNQLKEKFYNKNEVLNFWNEVKNLRTDFLHFYNKLVEYSNLSTKNWNYNTFFKSYNINKQLTYFVDVETATSDDIVYLKEKNIIPYGWGFIKLQKEVNENDNYDLVNYDHWYNLVDNVSENEKWYTHNLDYDYKYYIMPLIKNLGYKVINIDLLLPEKPIKLYPKQIYIFSSENEKVFYVLIQNSKNKSIKLECSLKKLPFSVAKMGKALADKYNDKNWLKKDLSYHLRPKNHNFNKTEHNYIFSDANIVKKFMNEIEIAYLEMVGKPLRWGLTASGTAMNILKNNHFAVVGKNGKYDYKKWNNLFVNKLTLAEWNLLKKGYTGGYTHFNFLYLNKKITIVKSMDINSAHPHKMAEHKMPFGTPNKDCKTVFCDKEHFAMFEIEVIKNCITKTEWSGINLCQIEYNGINDYFPFLKIGMKFNVSNIKLKMLQEIFTDFNDCVKIKKLMCFKQKIITQCTEYVNMWIDLKNKSRNNKPMYDFCKLMINGIYGKKGQSPHPEVTTFSDELHKSVENDVIKIKPEKLSYIPFAIAIADLSRFQVFEMIKLIGPKYFIYADTDSVYHCNLDIQLPDDLFDPEKLGKWGDVQTVYDFKVIGKKKYIYWNKEKTERVIKCAGLPDEIKKQIKDDDFKVGFSVSGKKAKTKLNGMPLIGLTTYTIKNMIKTYILTLENNIRLCPAWYKERIKEIKKDYFIVKNNQIEFDERLSDEAVAVMNKMPQDYKY